MNPLLEQAQQIGLDDEQKTQAENTPTAEPNPGSYERFLATFGNPARWAGRG